MTTTEDKGDVTELSVELYGALMEATNAHLKRYESNEFVAASIPRAVTIFLAKIASSVKNDAVDSPKKVLDILFECANRAPEEEKDA
jgi:hypothetical protein